jgi:3'(2'), 5'-bisphosphate nucleotidase
MNLDNALLSAISAAEEASRVILDVYNSGNFEAEVKGDNSPLTLADKKGHAVIALILEATGIPVLSEEGKHLSYDERKSWEYFWMVDPLDGTKEFVKRNGEFTVNIALIHRHKPVIGVVAVPVTSEIFYASQGNGAFVKRDNQVAALPKRRTWALNEEGLRVVASRSHMNDQTQSFIDSLNKPILVSKGSSLKFMLLAEGKADVYPRYAPTMEWDTAAAHAIVNEVGLNVFEEGTEREIMYNKENLLNPYFLVR